MRLAVLAAFAALFASSAAASSVTSTITGVDETARVLTLADRSTMVMGSEVDMSVLRSGARVTILAEMDEDGFAPATRVILVD